MKIIYESDFQLTINTEILTKNVKLFNGTIVEKEFKKINKKYSKKYRDSAVYKDFIDKAEVWVIHYSNSKQIIY